jgi:PAS domain S-box-containing protein
VVRAYLAPGAPGGAGAGRRVLLAHDSPTQARLLRLHLEQAGFAVTQASDGQEALDLALAAPPDALVSDVLMPRLDGFKLAQAVRRSPRLARLPVVLVSAAYTEAADRDLARAAGASALVLAATDGRAVLDALLAALEQTPPPAAPDLPAEDYTRRVVRQLERQASLNVGLTRRVGLLEAELAVLAGFTESLRGGLGPDALLSATLHRCLDAAGVSRGAAFLAGPDGRLRLTTQIGFRDEEALAGLFGRADLLDAVLAAGEPAALPGPGHDGPADRDLLDRADAGSLLLTPLALGDERLGVFVLASSRPGPAVDWPPFARAVGAQLAQAVALARTIGRLAESEQRHRELSERFRLLVEGVKDQALLTLDAEGRITSWNRGAERLHGRRAEEVLGRHVGCLYTAEERERGQPARDLEEARSNGRCEREVRRQRGDGSTFWASVTLTALAEEGRLAGFCDLTRDVSERKALEQQYRQAQKMEAVGLLAGGVAHDFNNLLTVISGFTEMALAAVGGGALSGLLEEVLKASARAAALTRQLLAFSRKQVQAPVLLDLNALVADMGQMLKRLIGEHIVLATELSPHVLPVLADPGQVEQVVLNLAVNGRDAMPHGGRLTVATGRADGPQGPLVVLTVRDTGVGMDEATRRRMFEPFFTTKGPGKGTGLGLATVEGIVRQYGGQIEVETAPGRGTTFRVGLPQAAAGPAPRPPTRPQAPAGGHEVLLLVEDDAAVRGLSRRVLAAHGYRVLEATDGPDALRVGAEHAGVIDLLVTDVIMPGLSGREVADRLTRQRPGLRVLFVSGYTDDTLAPHRVLGVDGAFLPKPFTPDMLARKVRELLDRGRRRGR